MIHTHDDETRQDTGIYFLSHNPPQLPIVRHLKREWYYDRRLQELRARTDHTTRIELNWFECAGLNEVIYGG